MRLSTTLSFFTSLSNITMFSITSLIFACLIYYGAHGLPRPQIVGGTDAPDGLYPYQVSLNDRYTQTHLCGGAIVSKRYIITAAHCLERLNPRNVIIGVGSNLLYSQTTYKAEDLIIHPNYTRIIKIINDIPVLINVINDIGLIKLKKDIKFNSNTKPIALVSSDKNFDGVKGLIVTGWGNTSPNGPTPEHLQQIIVTGYSQETCRSNYYADIREHQVCTLEAGKGICDGDSGSALIYNGELVGIASFNRPLCAEGNPDVFTRVFHYRDWVKDILCNFSFSDSSRHKRHSESFQHLVSDKDRMTPDVSTCVVNWKAPINASSNQQLNILLGLFTTYLCIHSFL
ncbi:chymotrypsin-2-like [Temnothorax longispinosus]|uniref:chymotrypsin-2-like n=1 Tax=Temnothorax longispinosus TaxID=300112 RepID=UPI003A99A947